MLYIAETFKNALGWDCIRIISDNPEAKILDNNENVVYDSIDILAGTSYEHFTEYIPPEEPEEPELQEP